MLNLAALCSSGKTAKLNRRRQVEISDQIDFCHILSVCLAGLFANQAIAAPQNWFGGRGIRFGMIIGGNPDFDDEISWTKEGLRVLRDLYTNPAISPGYVIVQSWQANPTRYVPESREGTGTWMLLQAEKIAAQAGEWRDYY
jgi:hypothetical protein